MKKVRPTDSDPKKYGCPTICEYQINKEYFLSLHIPCAIFVFVESGTQGPGKMKEIAQGGRSRQDPDLALDSGRQVPGGAGLHHPPLSCLLLLRAQPGGLPAHGQDWQHGGRAVGRPLRITHSAVLHLPFCSSCSQRAYFLQTGSAKLP